MEGLPKLPGLDFENRLKQNHTVSHCFDFVNGYRIPRIPPTGIGGDPLKENSIAFVQQDDAVLYDPVLTYGRVKHPPVEPFRPHYVTYDKIVLTFKAFFKQSVPESPNENYRVRYVNIMYFMEDDSITVMEPTVLNCGFPQGRLVRRGKVPKNDKYDFYTWKDLNIGIDIDFYGIVYHTTDCDDYTKEFMNAQGVELNEPECLPIDPFTSNALIKRIQKVNKTPTDDDKLRRCLEFQGMVLTFDCVLDETDRPHGECMSYKIFYFLEDDTVAVKELKENREGRDHFPMLLKRTKLPRNWKQRPGDFPACFLETSSNEITEYYQPKHFKVGETIFIYGRRFLLLDCDAFTRKYFSDVLKDKQGNRLEIKFPEHTMAKRAFPEYLGLGTPEDSMASCYGLSPKPPKKDVIRFLMNANKNLRFGCVLDTAHPEDQIRQFILVYSLADGKIKINEPPIRNSGIQGGKFLKAELIVKPGSDPNFPEYYSAKDFCIGATLIIHTHRFRIVSADLYAYRYMMEHPEMFSPTAIDSVRTYCLLNGHLKEDIQQALEHEKFEYEQQQIVAKPEEPMSDMARCLKNVHVFEPADQKPELQSFNDTERYSSNDLAVGDCRYKVNPEKSLESDRTNSPKMPLNLVPTPRRFLAASCDVSTSACNRKTVNFDDESKCAHNKPVGGCLVCP